MRKYRTRHEQDVLRELFAHADTLLHSRVHAMLVVESVFFLAASTLLERPFLFFIVSILGLVATLLMVFSVAKLHIRIQWLIRQRRELEPVYHDYLTLRGMKLDSIERPNRWLLSAAKREHRGYRVIFDTGWLYSWLLSGVFVAGWIAFIGYGTLANCGCFASADKPTSAPRDCDPPPDSAKAEHETIRDSEDDDLVAGMVAIVVLLVAFSSAVGHALSINC